MTIERDMALISEAATASALVSRICTLEDAIAIVKKYAPTTKIRARVLHKLQEKLRESRKQWKEKDSHED